MYWTGTVVVDTVFLQSGLRQSGGVPDDSASQRSFWATTQCEVRWVVWWHDDRKTTDHSRSREPLFTFTQKSWMYFHFVKRCRKDQKSNCACDTVEVSIKPGCKLRTLSHLIVLGTKKVHSSFHRVPTNEHLQNFEPFTLYDSPFDSVPSRGVSIPRVIKHLRVRIPYYLFRTPRSLTLIPPCSWNVVEG